MFFTRSFFESLLIHNLIMNRSVLFHRENECEWRYVGIWADMLDKSILDFNEENKNDFLILFKEYDTLLQALQDNLQLRNLYNQYKVNKQESEIKKVEDKITNQILQLSEKTELFVYYKKTDSFMKVSYKDSKLTYSKV